MDQLTNVLNALLSIPSVVWVTVLGAAGVSVATQVIKKLLSLESEKMVMTIFTAISFAASGLDYILSSHNLPPTILGVNTVAIMGVATPLYIYAIKPLSQFIVDVKAYRSQIADKVAEVETINKVASLPETAVVNNGPNSTVVVPVPDVSAPQVPTDAPKVANF